MQYAPEVQYGLIGQQLSYSFSRKHFTEKFEQLGLPLVYELFELPEIDVVQKLWAANPQLVGLNVTIPYKQLVMPYLDEISPAAQAIGAVNVIHLTSGKKIGYNTDVIGFEHSLMDLLSGAKPHRALILGTGGAAKAVFYVLEKIGVEDILFVSRSPKQAHEISYTDLAATQHLGDHPLIVNSTPLGTYPDVETAPDLRYDQIGAQHYVFDLVYNPAETTFLKRAAANGASIQNGLPMLLGQAEAAWDIWQSEA